MKKYFLSLAVSMAALSGQAQFYVTNSYNKDMIHDVTRTLPSRYEFVLPQVNGFNVYKADLHIHTVFSDGEVTPEMRVTEAWNDGLDIISITDHMEYRRQEGKMIAFLKGNVKKDTKPINENIITKSADNRGIISDLNVPVELAKKAAAKYGITIIPGAEITREPVSIGHYNALFTTDNNKIYDPDPIQAMKNAKQQGALVMHNHPGWRRQNVDHPEMERKIYEEGLISGIETMNGGEFYPKVIDRAITQGLFVSSNTDAHGSITETYRAQGHRRNMTFILAKDQSLESIKEALLAKRTLAYSYGSVAGSEQLLKDLFYASVSKRVIAEDDKKVTMAFTNNSSLDFVLQSGSGVPFRFLPFTTITATVNKGSKLNWTVTNFWCGEKAHPVVTF